MRTETQRELQNITRELLEAKDENAKLREQLYRANVVPLEKEKGKEKEERPGRRRQSLRSGVLMRGTPVTEDRERSRSRDSSVGEDALAGVEETPVPTPAKGRAVVHPALTKEETKRIAAQLKELATAFGEEAVRASGAAGSKDARESMWCSLEKLKREADEGGWSLTDTEGRVYYEPQKDEFMEDEEDEEDEIEEVSPPTNAKKKAAGTRKQPVRKVQKATGNTATGNTAPEQVMVPSSGANKPKAAAKRQGKKPVQLDVTAQAIDDILGLNDAKGLRKYLKNNDLVEEEDIQGLGYKGMVDKLITLIKDNPNEERFSDFLKA